MLAILALFLGLLLPAVQASGPEMNAKAFDTAIGPHRGGFHYASGFQQGVDFMPGGESDE